MNCKNSTFTGQNHIPEFSSVLQLVFPVTKVIFHSSYVGRMVILCTRGHKFGSALGNIHDLFSVEEYLSYPDALLCVYVLKAHYQNHLCKKLYQFASLSLANDLHCLKDCCSVTGQLIGQLTGLESVGVT